MLEPAQVKIKGVPWGMLRLLGLFNPMLRELAKMAYLWRVPHQLDQTGLEKVLGPVAATPLPGAMAQTLRELFPAKSQAAALSC